MNWPLRSRHNSRVEIVGDVQQLHARPRPRDRAAASRERPTKKERSEEAANRSQISSRAEPRREGDSARLSIFAVHESLFLLELSHRLNNHDPGSD